MTIQVILAGPLKKYNPGASHLELKAEEGWTVADVIRSLDIPEGSYSFVSIAGRKVSDDTLLKQYDQVKIFPPVSGG
jgi:molybdopterin converting factor small subunit